jgi:hypothetical protein
MRVFTLAVTLGVQVTAGKVLFDPLSQKCPILHQIYRKRFVDTWSSRQMLETIRNKKSKEAAISKRDVKFVSAPYNICF